MSTIALTSTLKKTFSLTQNHYPSIQQHDASGTYKDYLRWKWHHEKQEFPIAHFPKNGWRTTLPTIYATVFTSSSDVQLRYDLMSNVYSKSALDRIAWFNARYLPQLHQKQMPIAPHNCTFIRVVFNVYTHVDTIYTCTFNFHRMQTSDVWFTIPLAKYHSLMFYINPDLNRNQHLFIVKQKHQNTGGGIYTCMAYVLHISMYFE